MAKFNASSVASLGNEIKSAAASLKPKVGSAYLEGLGHGAGLMDHFEKLAAAMISGDRVGTGKAFKSIVDCIFGSGDLESVMNATPEGVDAVQWKALWELFLQVLPLFINLVT